MAKLKDLQKKKEHIRAIRVDIAKKIANATGVPVFLASEKDISFLVNVIKKEKGIVEHYSDNELWQEVSDTSPMDNNVS